MNIRKITSMTMFISFILLVVTSIVLYITPHGRVAYWADWHFWGLTKTEWGNLHINLGFLFLFAGLLHMYFNWAPITAYMKNRAREIKIFTPAFSVALLLCVVVGLGTYFEIPPMSSVIQWADSIKNDASKKYGEPPYGHAELSSLKLFVKKQDLDMDQVASLLSKANVKFSSTKDTLATIAAANQMSPQELYTIIKPAMKERPEQEGSNFPDSPMAGFGNKSLAEVCAEFNLVFPVIQRGLAEAGIKAEADMTIKEIAKANGKEPMEIFEEIHSLVTSGHAR